MISEDFSRTRFQIWPELTFLFDRAQKGEKVLDSGCGNGRFYPLLKEKGVKYFGADNSEKLVAIAKNKYPEADFIVADALKLPFEDNYFDKIFSIAVLHHIPSKELRLEFLEEAKRVLKKDGVIIIAVWKFHQPKEFFYLFKYTIFKLFRNSQLDFMDIEEPWGKRAKRYYHWFFKKELDNLAKEAGFKIIGVGFTKNKRGNRKNIYLVAKK